MKYFTFGPADYDRLIRQRERNQQESPMQWVSVIDRLSLELLGEKVQPFHNRWRAESDGILFASLPDRNVFRAAVCKQPFLYLCWGIRWRSVLRSSIDRMILKRATAVFVNDHKTREDVFAFAGRQATVIPYTVDTNFFAPNDAIPSSDYLFCPGSNSRDPQCLVGLAERGHRIKWLCSDPTLRAKYGGRIKNLSICHDVSFMELRDLYQRSRLVINPLCEDVHAAGQTTTLEALACGKTCVLSAGRTSGIFSDFPKVKIVDGQLNEWDRFLSACESSEDLSVDRRLLFDHRFAELTTALTTTLSTTSVRGT